MQIESVITDNVQFVTRKILTIPMDRVEELRFKTLPLTEVTRSRKDEERVKTKGFPRNCSTMTMKSRCISLNCLQRVVAVLDVNSIVNIARNVTQEVRALYYTNISRFVKRYLFNFLPLIFPR